MFLSYLAKLNGQRLRSSLISANLFACGRAGNRKLVLLFTLEAQSKDHKLCADATVELPKKKNSPDYITYRSQSSCTWRASKPLIRRPPIGKLRGSTVVDGDAFGKFDGVGESDLRNGLRLEGGQWVK